MPKSDKPKGSISRRKQSTMGNFFSKTDKKSPVKQTEESKSTKTGQGVKKTTLQAKKTIRSMWGNWADKDTEKYRRGYPGKKDILEDEDNLLFYKNKMKSKPDGGLIDDIHKDWYGDYNKLEAHHGYIQWLFPIRETGLNWHSQELQLHEIKSIVEDSTAKERILTSYKMMLDFYGMRLKDEKTGEIERSDNWPDRFRHLNRSYHNYLRITRILKCLGEFEYEYLKVPFVKFVMEEGVVHETLDNLMESCMKYWVGVIKDDDERKEVKDYYNQLYDQQDVLSFQNEREQKDKKPRTPPTGKDSDSEDDTMEYGPSLIDNQSGSDEDIEPGTESSTSKPARKAHTLSDSDEESQEAKYWQDNENSSAIANKTPDSEVLNEGTEKLSDEKSVPGVMSKNIKETEMVNEMETAGSDEIVDEGKGSKTENDVNTDINGGSQKTDNAKKELDNEVDSVQETGNKIEGIKEDNSVIDSINHTDKNFKADGTEVTETDKVLSDVGTAEDSTENVKPGNDIEEAEAIANGTTVNTADEKTSAKEGNVDISDSDKEAVVVDKNAVDESKKEGDSQREEMDVEEPQNEQMES